LKKTTFFLLCLEGVVLSFNVASAAALIPSISQEFGISQFVAGKIVWLYMLAYGIAALFYGPLVKIVNAKKIELVCFLLFCLANLLAAVSRNIITLFAARLLMGIFGASVIPLVLILIGKYTGAQNRGRLVGIFFSTTFVASLLGLFLSGIIHWRLIFLIPAIFGLLLWVCMCFYLENFKVEAQVFSINYLAAFRSKAVVSIFSYIFCISLFYHGIQQWLSVYFSGKFNYNQFLISTLITLTSFSGIIGEIVGGICSDAWGRIKTINTGIILMSIVAFLLIAKLPLLILAVLMIIWGLGWTINHAGISTLLTDLPKEFLNESASLNSSVRFIAGGLGVGISGVLMQRNLELGFFIFGSGLLLLFVFAKKLLVIRGESI
jgi:predicted MFS family arabinose efflux permease